jgi:hypothetical protein
VCETVVPVGSRACSDLPPPLVRPLALALFFSLTLTACDHEDPGGASPAGSYALRVTGTSALGPLDRTIEGRALYAVVGVDGVPRLQIQLQNSPGDLVELFTLTAATDAVPAPGVYPGTAPQGGAEGALEAAFTRGQDAPFFFEDYRGEAGTVTITAASASRIEGRVDLTLSTGPHTVEAEGTFTATPGR